MSTFYYYQVIIDVQQKLDRYLDLEFIDPVAFSQLQLEYFNVGNVSSQTSQTLLARSSHSDCESVATVGLQDPVDPTSGKVMFGTPFY